MSSPPILETDRLSLRPLRLEDVDDLHQVLGDPETMRFYPEPFSRELVQAWIEDSVSRYEADGFGLWAAELKTTGQLVGDCGPAVREVDEVAEIELGWHVKREFW